MLGHLVAGGRLLPGGRRDIGLGKHLGDDLVDDRVDQLAHLILERERVTVAVHDVAHERNDRAIDPRRRHDRPPW